MNISLKTYHHGEILGYLPSSAVLRSSAPLLGQRQRRGLFIQGNHCVLTGGKHLAGGWFRDFQKPSTTVV